eukprot:7387531-Prymnesium_polylepis.2
MILGQRAPHQPGQECGRAAAGEHAIPLHGQNAQHRSRAWQSDRVQGSQALRQVDTSVTRGGLHDRRPLRRGSTRRHPDLSPCGPLHAHASAPLRVRVCGKGIEHHRGGSVVCLPGEAKEASDGREERARLERLLSTTAVQRERAVRFGGIHARQALSGLFQDDCVRDAACSMPHAVQHRDERKQPADVSGLGSVAAVEAHVGADCLQLFPLGGGAVQVNSATPRGERERGSSDALGEPSRREQPEPRRAAGDEVARLGAKRRRMQVSHDLLRGHKARHAEDASSVQYGLGLGERDDLIEVGRGWCVDAQHRQLHLGPHGARQTPRARVGSEGCPMRVLSASCNCASFRAAANADSASSWRLPRSVEIATVFFRAVVPPLVGRRLAIGLHSVAYRERCTIDSARRVRVVKLSSCASGLPLTVPAHTNAVSLVPCRSATPHKSPTAPCSSELSTENAIGIVWSASEMPCASSRSAGCTSTACISMLERCFSLPTEPAPTELLELRPTPAHDCASLRKAGLYCNPTVSKRS